MECHSKLLFQLCVSSDYLQTKWSMNWTGREAGTNKGHWPKVTHSPIRVHASGEMLHLIWPWLTLLNAIYINYLPGILSFSNDVDLYYMHYMTSSIWMDQEHDTGSTFISVDCTHRIHTTLRPHVRFRPRKCPLKFTTFNKWNTLPLKHVSSKQQVIKYYM